MKRLNIKRKLGPQSQRPKSLAKRRRSRARHRRELPPGTPILAAPAQVHFVSSDVSWSWMPAEKVNVQGGRGDLQMAAAPAPGPTT